MHIHTFSRPAILFLALGAFFCAAALLAPAGARAATCVFSATNLELGSVSEEVRCLQRYLNSAGFPVAVSGVGSPGRETNQYQTKTAAAVAKWQAANGISPATGTFGPLSRAKYIILTGTPTPAPTPAPVPVPVPTVPTVSADERNARSAILDLRDSYEDALDDYETAKSKKKTLGKSKSYLAEAEAHILDALYAFVDQDYRKAETYAEDAEYAIEDALDELDARSSGKTSSKKATRTQAKAELADVEDAIEDAWDEVDDSSSSNSRIRKAEDLLLRAEDLLERAEDSYSDSYYDEAIEYAEEAMELVEDALNAL